MILSGSLSGWAVRACVRVGGRPGVCSSPQRLRSCMTDARQTPVRRSSDARQTLVRRLFFTRKMHIPVKEGLLTGTPEAPCLDFLVNNRRLTSV